MRRVPVFHCLIAAVALLAAAVAPAPVRAAQGQDLQTIESKERKLLIELESLEKRVSEMEDRLAVSEEQIAALNRKIAGGDSERKKLDTEADRLEKALARRLRAMYMMRDGGLMQALFQAPTFSDFTSRYRYLSLILGQDRNMLDQYSRLQGELKQSQTALEANKADLLTANRQLNTERNQLNRTLHDKTNLLMEIHRKKVLYQAMLDRQEAAHQTLVNTMFVRRGSDDAPEAPDESVPPASSPPEKKAKPEKKPEKISHFAELKGKLPWPVKGRLKKKFGSQSGSSRTYQNGVLFSAGSGAEIRTVVDGKVIYTGWMNGFGNIIIVDHGKRYYTLTGGLSGLRFKTGDQVRQGEILGTIPGTGANAKKEIYFEIRHGGRAVDPLPWLKETPG